MDPLRRNGHIYALLTITIWGITYIATKVLLAYYTPTQLLFIRFVIAFLVLLLLQPKPFLWQGWRDEGGFLLLSLSGVTLYYLFENIALNYTLATNVSIIITFAPIATAIAVHLLTPNSCLSRYSFLGSIIALCGVALVVFNGTFVLKLNPLGDLLSIGAMICWTAYSVMVEHYLKRYDNIAITRRMLLYAIIIFTPLCFFTDGWPELSPLFALDTGAAILLLGVFGGGICFLWWAKAIRNLGVVTATNYIYLSPFITMVSGWLLIDEPITLLGFLGAVLTILGVFLADYVPKEKRTKSS